MRADRAKAPDVLVWRQHVASDGVQPIRSKGAGGPQRRPAVGYVWPQRVRISHRRRWALHRPRPARCRRSRRPLDGTLLGLPGARSARPQAAAGTSLPASTRWPLGRARPPDVVTLAPDHQRGQALGQVGAVLQDEALRRRPSRQQGWDPRVRDRRPGRRREGGTPPAVTGARHPPPERTANGGSVDRRVNIPRTAERSEGLEMTRWGYDTHRYRGPA